MPLLALLVLAPSGWSGSATMAAASSAAPATWTTYFFPTVVGNQCHLALQGATFSGTETLTVHAVNHTAAGTKITVFESGATQVNGKGIPTNAALHYLITTKGGLVAVPSSLLLAGQSASITGNTVLPTVASLFAGTTSNSSFSEVVPLTPSDISQLSGVLLPHQTSLHASLVLRSTGSEINSLTMPVGSLGTLHNVLRVQSSIASVKVTNVVKAAQGALDAAVKKETAPLLNFTELYAPKIGPVEATVDNITTYTTSCAR
jgi:hypothetical protein